MNEPTKNKQQEIILAMFVNQGAFYVHLNHANRAKNCRIQGWVHSF